MKLFMLFCFTSVRQSEDDDDDDDVDESGGKPLSGRAKKAFLLLKPPRGGRGSEEVEPGYFLHYCVAEMENA